MTKTDCQLTKRLFFIVLLFDFLRISTFYETGKPECLEFVDASLLPTNIFRLGENDNAEGDDYLNDAEEVFTEESVTNENTTLPVCKSASSIMPNGVFLSCLFALLETLYFEIITTFNCNFE